MVDIHSHILWGLDDGARTFEDSVAMVKMAAESGTTAIVATPHANLEFVFQPDVVAQKSAELAAAVPGITIYTGCDFHLSIENIQDAIVNPGKYTINRTQYLLVEFPDMVTFTTTPQIFEKLRQAGMIPIITHPERNVFLQGRTDDMARWVQDGAYIQVTAQSFTGRFGKRAQDSAHELVRLGLVHFVASDAHDLQHRTTRLNESADYLKERFGNDIAEILFVQNPSAVITGGIISRLEPKPARKWYRFW